MGLQTSRRCVHGVNVVKLLSEYLSRSLGMLSCQQTKNIIDGKKRIILNPSETQKRDFEGISFAESEVYGMDILISSGEDGKVVCIKLDVAFLALNLSPGSH